jgi:hypothetical protein
LRRFLFKDFVAISVVIFYHFLPLLVEILSAGAIIRVGAEGMRPQICEKRKKWP